MVLTCIGIGRHQYRQALTKGEGEGVRGESSTPGPVSSLLKGLSSWHNIYDIRSRWPKPTNRISASTIKLCYHGKTGGDDCLCYETRLAVSEGSECFEFPMFISRM